MDIGQQEWLREERYSLILDIPRGVVPLFQPHTTWPVTPSGFRSVRVRWEGGQELLLELAQVPESPNQTVATAQI